MSRTGEQSRLAPLQWSPYGPGGLPPHLCNDSDEEKPVSPGELVRGFRRVRTIGEYTPFMPKNNGDEDEDDGDDEEEEVAPQSGADDDPPSSSTPGGFVHRPSCGDIGILTANSGWTLGADPSTVNTFMPRQEQCDGVPAPAQAHAIGPMPPGIFVRRGEGNATVHRRRIVPDAKASPGEPRWTPTPSEVSHAMAARPPSAPRTWRTPAPHVYFGEAPQENVWESAGYSQHDCQNAMSKDEMQHGIRAWDMPKQEGAPVELWKYYDQPQNCSPPYLGDAATLVGKPQFADDVCNAQEDADADSDTTTVMVQNIPRRIAREDFLNMLNSQGFEGKFDYFYLPRSFNSSSNKGYAFLNFVDLESAQTFRQTWHLSYMMGADKRPRQKPLRVTRAAVQGRCNNLRVASSKKMSRIRNASCKPLVL